MAGFRFLHSSDLHLGKPFGRFGEEVRADLGTARQKVISTLVAAARARGVQHILLAGDTFDQEAPTLRLIRQTITAMAGAEELHWWILPGNHDSLQASLIWDTFAEQAPSNVTVLRAGAPLEISAGVWLLPAPCPRRSSGYDLTEWMTTQETPVGALRIGLAHGGVTDFRPEEPSAETIPPDRAERSRLDYLALGDWHGALGVTPRSRYSGAPERTDFRHAGRGICLCVTLPGPGAIPEVEEIGVGRYNWQAPDLAITPEMDAIAALRSLLPEDRGEWRETLVQLELSGHIHLEARMRLMDELRGLAPEFCAFEWRDRALHTEYRPDDLDEIARSGAMRLTAETLRDKADDPDLSRADRDIADAALTRLYTLVKDCAE